MLEPRRGILTGMAHPDTALESRSLIGCSKPESRVAQGNRDQVLHLGNLSESTDLDPHVATSQQNFFVISALFEGLSGYSPKDADAAAFLFKHTTTAKDNYSDWSNVRYDQLMTAAITERDRTRRNELYRQAEAIFVEEFPVLPNFLDAYRYLVHPPVKGLGARRLG